MKRTELKRKTPLKAKTPLKKTAFKKKPKKKKKSKLQKRIDKMDSPYWDKKCHAAVAEWAHLMPCLICGKREPEVTLVCGHHLIRKSKSRLHRWHPMNIVPLCGDHHIYSIAMAAHSESILAVARFVDYLCQFHPKHHSWLVRYAASIRKTDMRVGQIERPDWRYQSGIWQQRAADARIIRQETNDG